MMNLRCLAMKKERGKKRRRKKTKTEPSAASVAYPTVPTWSGNAARQASDSGWENSSQMAPREASFSCSSSSVGLGRCQSSEEPSWRGVESRCFPPTRAKKRTEKVRRQASDEGNIRLRNYYLYVVSPFPFSFEVFLLLFCFFPLPKPCC